MIMQNYNIYDPMVSARADYPNYTRPAVYSTIDLFQGNYPNSETVDTLGFIDLLHGGSRCYG
ncbi:hypothetical protein GCM10023310_03490 [Paenibacillus vulneris]